MLFYVFIFVYCFYVFSFDREEFIVIFRLYSKLFFKLKYIEII